MLIAKVENYEVKNWGYERWRFHSTILNLEFHIGFFCSNSKAKISRTVYLLHGGNADDTQVVQAGLLPVIVDILSQGSQENIQFVFPYVGTSFLHDHPVLSSKSFSRYFINELIPACEVGTQMQSENRFICGWSMGGHAALNMFMREPDRFGGVGAHFPTLVTFDYTDKKQLAAYARRQQVSDAMLSVLVADFQNEFADFNDFSNFDPLTLARTKDKADWIGKKIYFDIGGQDEFGLSEGAKALHEVLQQKNVSHQFELITEGKHDAHFINSQINKMLNYLL